MEKEHQPDSMATITMKAEYPPSEVYSTSEPPPAYRQRTSNSVQIARIVALTVIASSFILGAFILASSWVSARASCHQLEQLDAMLDKELALEGRSYGNDGLLPDEPLPINNAHALHASPELSAHATSTGAPAPPPVSSSQTKDDALNHAESKIEEDKLQKIDDDSSKPNTVVSSDSDESSDSDSSTEDDEDLDVLKPMMKLPIQFDLDELAGAFLANNQKGRMNCVVERRHEDPMERRFPFNILGAFAPRSARAERVAIICHGGDEPRPMNFPEPQSQVFAFPLSGPVRLPLRPQADRPSPAPEPRLPFAPMGQRGQPFPLPMPWDSAEEQMGPAPREMRIHVQRVIAIPSPPRNMPPPPENMPFAPPPMSPPQPREQNEQPTVLHQFVPQPAPTQELEQHDGNQVDKIQLDGTPTQNLPWGLSPEDLHIIQRTAEEAVGQRQNQQQQQQQMDNDMQEVKTIVNSLAAAAEAEAQAQATADAEARQNDEEERQEPRLMAMAKAPRTLLLPQRLPGEDRPHYMQPRSVRSVDALLHREKRVKRCACNCR